MPTNVTVLKCNNADDIRPLGKIRKAPGPEYTANDKDIPTTDKFCLDIVFVKLTGSNKSLYHVLGFEDVLAAIF